MRVFLYIILDSGGSISLQGKDLSAEDVTEIFDMLGTRRVIAGEQLPENIDTPLPRSQGQG